MEPHGPETPHVPPPTLWPIGFAVGVVLILAGLVVGWAIVLLGAVLAAAFGFLWVRDLTSGVRSEPVPDVEPESRAAARTVGTAPPAASGRAGMPLADEEEVERYPRSVFLEGATLGLGGVIGGLVTVPALGLMVVPPFVDQESNEVDVGPVDKYPEGQWRITTYLENPEEGEVTRRTVFIRNNGEVDGAASFTVIANNCVHLGCPVQPSGPIEEENAEEEKTSTSDVRRIPTDPAGGFACPCHGGAYNSEGDRTSGPPVRALDRFEFAVRNGNLFLTQRYSVAKVEGSGKEARIKKYGLAAPGVHVDGISSWLYPVEPPR